MSSFISLFLYTLFLFVIYVIRLIDVIDGFLVNFETLGTIQECFVGKEKTIIEVLLNGFRVT